MVYPLKDPIPLVFSRFNGQDLLKSVVPVERSRSEEDSKHEHQWLNNERLVRQELVQDVSWPSLDGFISTY